MYTQTTETKVSQKIFVPAVCNALDNFPFNSIKPCTLMPCALIWPWPCTLMSWTTHGSLAVLLDYSLPKLASLWPSTLCVCTISSDGKLSEARKNIFQFTLCTCYAKSLQLFLTLCELMDCSLPGYSVCGDSAGKNTEVGCHALPSRGLFLTQVLNLCLLWLLRWQAGFFFFFFTTSAHLFYHLGSPQFTLANINWTLTINKAVNYFHTAVLSKGLHPEYLECWLVSHCALS